MNYFDKFPTISYGGVLAKNLLARVVLTDQTKNNKTMFYPYTIQNELRADQVSDRYYDTPGYSWLIWYANDMVDPYYDYPLSSEDFDRFVTTKYGSIDQAQRSIKHYRINWVGDTSVLTYSQFTALSGPFKKYYDPLLNANMELTGYVRKRDDEVLATNKVISLDVVSTGTFTIGEEVRQSATNYAFCLQSNSTNVLVQHVVGDITANSTITGMQSNTTATVTAANTLSTTIASTEASYWSPVTFYDYELEQNEQKKQIRLIDARFSGQINDELKRLNSQ